MPKLIPKAVESKEKPKKNKIKTNELFEITPELADKYAAYIKSLNRETHINPLVKRITYKDGKTRIGVIYEFVQLWNEFVKNGDYQ